MYAQQEEVNKMSAMMKWLSIILICFSPLDAVEASWRRQQNNNNNYVGYNYNNRDRGIRQQRHHPANKQRRHPADRRYGTTHSNEYNNNCYSPNFDMLNDNHNNNDRDYDTNK